ncbi:MAG TPA: class I SAM-dependent methyltransferase [Candidatus Brocadiia bacterium]|nr:class I SAM-dependent methyltransferase [Candidatus Brocadiia bacterium]
MRKERVWRVLGPFFQAWIPESSDILDIRCGFGEFLNNVRGRRRIGIDLNPQAREYLDGEIEFRCGDVRDLSAIGDESFDCVFCSNLLEHLESKQAVEALARDVARILRAGGQFIIMGPNCRLLPGAYWDFWDHHVAITERSLSELLRATGFSIENLFARFLPYTTKGALPARPWLVRFYLNMPIVWPLFGRQFLIRARKSGGSKS